MIIHITTGKMYIRGFYIMKEIGRYFNVNIFVGIIFKNKIKAFLLL
jgi:hypothetical protein